MAQQKVEITCDACGATFTLDEKSNKFRMSGELLFRYFKCPSCGSAFMVSVTNKKFRKMLNSGRVGVKMLRVLQDALNEQYFPRFKELFTAAYRKDDAKEDVNKNGEAEITDE